MLTRNLKMGLPEFESGSQAISQQYAKKEKK